MWTEQALFMPGPPVATQPRKQICWLDRHTGIIVANRKAVRLPWMQFAMFKYLHEAEGKKLTSKVLYEKMYGGARNPPGTNVIPVLNRQINLKLKHLGLKIQGVNRNKYSFYQIIRL